MGRKSEAILAELRAWGLSLPGAHGKSPWPEHDDLAVRDKTFAYLPAKDNLVLVPSRAYPDCRFERNVRG